MGFVSFPLFVKFEKQRAKFVKFGKRVKFVKFEKRRAKFVKCEKQKAKFVKLKKEKAKFVKFEKQRAARLWNRTPVARMSAVDFTTRLPMRIFGIGLGLLGGRFGIGLEVILDSLSDRFGIVWVSFGCRKIRG